MIAGAGLVLGVAVLFCLGAILPLHYALILGVDGGLVHASRCVHRARCLRQTARRSNWFVAPRRRLGAGVQQPGAARALGCRPAQRLDPVARATPRVPGRLPRPSARGTLHASAVHARRRSGRAAVAADRAAVVGRPFARVGADLPDGRAYRAYFTADFVWRMAVAAELSKGDVPPRNQFYLDDPLRYYWLPHLLPAIQYRLQMPPHAARAGAARQLGRARSRVRGVLLRVDASACNQPRSCGRRLRERSALHELRGRRAALVPLAPCDTVRRDPEPQYRRHRELGVRRAQDRRPAAAALVSAAPCDGLCRRIVGAVVRDAGARGRPVRHHGMDRHAARVFAAPQHLRGADAHQHGRHLCRHPADQGAPLRRACDVGTSAPRLPLVLGLGDRHVAAVRRSQRIADSARAQSRGQARRDRVVASQFSDAGRLVRRAVDRDAVGRAVRGHFRRHRLRVGAVLLLRRRHRPSARLCRLAIGTLHVHRIRRSRRVRPAGTLSKRPPRQDRDRRHRHHPRRWRCPDDGDRHLQHAGRGEPVARAELPVDPGSAARGDPGARLDPRAHTARRDRPGGAVSAQHEHMGVPSGVRGAPHGRWSSRSAWCRSPNTRRRANASKRSTPRPTGARPTIARKRCGSTT